MDNYQRTEKYDKCFLSQNFMGPNAILMIDEITQSVELTKEMRVLDLGCGMGLTSIFLAKEYGVQTFAVDLWITATDNYKRFLQMGVDDFSIMEMDCTDTAWSDWLAADNPIAKQDIDMIKADNGKYLNLISITGKRK
ncbi:methyltransferase [Acetobacterium fimetarium]|uniref:Methyltransferase n=1 Tax=Acetobacterium fimetarium TaxID=52691 RepID=A0ABR6WX84_9FIRM|nr:methyltransferase [Acetobacterium fimetarium]MBC3805233.1 methyltransferase [Acetobacterium fimetarium]